MKVECIKVGFLEENCYILSIGEDALVIDPGDEADKIIKVLEGKNVLAILITHYHFDHVGALSVLKEKYNPIIIDHKNKVEKVGPFKFEIIDTKGHKEDCVTYYFKEEKKMFVGDFIFKECIGRCDLPGGNKNEMKESLNKIKEYDKDIILYPGHDKITTLGYELLNNVYMKGDFYE